MIFIYVFESFLINSRRLMWSSIGYLETDSVNETLKRSAVRRHVSGKRSQRTRAGCWDRERKGLWAEDVAGRSIITGGVSLDARSPTWSSSSTLAHIFSVPIPASLSFRDSYEVSK